MMTLHQENGLILIIHPQAMVSSWLQQTLTDFGHSVTVADDLAQGLMCLEQERHHLLIVDLALMQEPSLSQLARETPETPVITVSGDVSMDEVLEGLKMAQLTIFFVIEIPLF
jgi:DNA-binding response OmpR family regulator